MGRLDFCRSLIRSSPKMKTFLLVAFFFAFAAAKVQYDGHSVWRVQVNSDADLKTLKDNVKQHDIDVWSEGLKHIDLRMSPILQSKMRVAFLKAGIKYDVMIPNIQTLIDAQEAEIRNSPKVYDSSGYNNYQDIVDHMNDIANTNANAVISTVGTTYENRSMVMLQFSTDATPGAKSVIYIDCGIHAREWVTQATCLHGIDQLDAGNAEFMALLDTYDVHIMPVTNPDGYVYTWTDARMDRKNRRPNTDVGSNCIGTDLNRNFVVGWGGTGSSSDPCSSTYSGPSPGSEAETTAVRNLFTGSRTYASMYSIHSYGQMWMYAYGYTYDFPPDNAALDANAQVGVTALTAVYGTAYTYGTIANTIYIASGGTVDTAYNDGNGILYSFTLELRDEGDEGFLLPEAQIIPTAQETWAGILAAINAQ